MTRKIALLMAMLLLLLAGCSNQPAVETPAPVSETTVPEQTVATEPFALESIVIHGYEWSPAVDVIVLKPNGEVGEYDVSTFAVTTCEKSRTVTEAFRCDASGNAAEDGQSV